jgi:hypothetical protein
MDEVRDYLREGNIDVLRTLSVLHVFIWEESVQFTHFCQVANEF